MGFEVENPVEVICPLEECANIEVGSGMSSERSRAPIICGDVTVAGEPSRRGPHILSELCQAKSRGGDLLRSRFVGEVAT